MKGEKSMVSVNIIIGSSRKHADLALTVFDPKTASQHRYEETSTGGM